MGFPQYGFKPRCLSDQPYPARSRREVKHQVRIPPYLQRFDRAFVMVPTFLPSWGHYQPTQPQVTAMTTSAHGSLASERLCCPSHLRYYDPIRQSRWLPPISQGHWLYGRSVPDDLVWAALETFPALGQRSFLACHRPYAERRNGEPPAPPRSQWLSATKQCVSSSISPDTSFRRGFAYDATAFA